MPALESRYRTPRTRSVASLLAVALGAGATGLLSALPAYAADTSAQPLFVETSAQARDSATSSLLRVEIADMNQDGMLDMVSPAQGTGFNVELGSGDGTFQAPVKTAAGGTGSSVSVGDVNGDSYPDVIANSYDNGVDSSAGVSLTVYLGTPTGTDFVAGFRGGHNSATALADLDLDGNLDLLQSSAFANQIYAGDGLGGFAAVATSFSGGATYPMPAPVDFNGDGWPDVVMPNLFTDSIHLVLSDPESSSPFVYLPAQEIPTATSVYGVVTGDADGDGDQDFAYTTSGVAGQVHLARNNGLGSFTETILASGNLLGSPVIADLNGDGANDVAYPLTGSVRLLLGNGAGGYVSASRTHGAVGTPFSLSVGDFNGDNQIDVVAPEYSNPVNHVLTNLGNAAAPTVTSQPTAQTVSTGEPFSFTATAAGNPAPSVRWERSTDGGASYSLLSDASAFSTTYTGSSTSGMDGDLYRAVFANGEAPDARSDSAQLTVEYSPVVITHPADQAVNDGTTATFSVAGESQPDYTVQWQISSDDGDTFGDLPGAIGETLSYPATSADDGLRFRAVLSNWLGAYFSGSALLTVNSAPAITMQPSDQSVSDGSEVTFSARSDDPTANVGWAISYDDGATFFGVGEATSEDYTFTAWLNADGQQLYAVFSNELGGTKTQIATLTVNANAPTVIEDPQSQTVDSGMSAVFRADASSNPEATVQWQVSTDDGARFDDLVGETEKGLAFWADYSLNGNLYRAVFTNPGGPATTESALLTVTPIAPQVTDHPDYVTVLAGESVTFAAAADGDPASTVQWQVSVDGGNNFADADGATDPSYTFTAAAVDTGSLYQALFTNAGGTGTSSPALLTVNVAPVVTAAPEDQTVVEGEVASFTAEASGQPSPSVQWQVSVDDGLTFQNVEDANQTTYEFTPLLEDDGNLYQAVFVNDGGSAISTSAALAVTALPVFETPSAPLGVTATQTGPGEITVTWDAPADEGSSPVTGYEVSYSNAESGSGAGLLGTARSTVFTGVADGDYLVSVTSMNGTGPSEPASVEVVVATATAPPPPPADPTPVDDESDTTAADRALAPTGTETSAMASAIASLLFMGTLMLIASRHRRPGRRAA